MINIECAEFLNLNHNLQFWGEIFNYRNVQNLNIRGRIRDESSGVMPVDSIFDNSDELLADLKDFDEINLNGYSIGSGRITNVSFDSGLDVVSKPYSIRVEVLKTGDLYNLTGSVYDGTNMPPIDDVQYVESLQEDFNFNFNSTEGIYDYNRSVNLSMESGKLPDPIQSAKNIVDVFFLNDPLITALNAAYPNFYISDGKRVRSETYDKRNLRFSFSENFTFQPDQKYTWAHTHTTSLDRHETLVTERGAIVSSTDNPNVYESALSGFNNDVKTGIYNRCNQVFNSWSGVIGASGCSLKETPIRQGINYDECAGSISYDYEYTTNQSINNCYTHNYTLSSSREDSIYNVSERGSICETCDTDRLSGAIDRFSDPNFKTDVLDRVSGAYVRSSQQLPCGASGLHDLKELSNVREFSRERGCVNYTYNYTNDPLVINSGDIFKVEVSRETTYPVHFNNNFNILNHKEIVQQSNQSLLANYTNNINVIGNTGAYLESLLSGANSYVQKPSGEDAHMIDATYDWEPKSRSLNLTVIYAYTEFREFEDILIW